MKRLAHSKLVSKLWSHGIGRLIISLDKQLWYELLYRYARNGMPSWDIGRPQPEIVKLAQSGEIKGTVLDVGCGTGENSLSLADLGYDVCGIDSSRTAIRRAIEKAQSKDLKVSFLRFNVFDVPRLGKKFDTVIDCGLFSFLGKRDPSRYGQTIHSVLRAGGIYFSLSSANYVSPEDILHTFQDGWRLNYTRPARKIQTEGECNAWLSSISKL